MTGTVVFGFYVCDESHQFTEDEQCNQPPDATTIYEESVPANEAIETACAYRESKRTLSATAHIGKPLLEHFVGEFQPLFY